MKTRIAILLVLELLAGVMVLSISHANGPATKKAFAEWRNQPTAENRASFDRQRKIQRKANLMDEGALWLGFSAVAVPLILLFPFRKSPRVTPLETNP